MIVFENSKSGLTDTFYEQANLNKYIALRLYKLIMDNKAITIKADDYRFPTRDERKATYAAEPELRPIGFEFTSPLVAILNENVPVKDAHQRDNLHWWIIVSKIAYIIYHKHT